MRILLSMRNRGVSALMQIAKPAPSRPHVPSLAPAQLTDPRPDRPYCFSRFSAFTLALRTTWRNEQRRGARYELPPLHSMLVAA
jgi:hypothetical protein